MTVCPERTNTRRIGDKVRSTRGLGVLVGVLMAAWTGGPAAPAHAQACDPVEVTKLLAAGGAAGDEFGDAVAVSGDTAVIGAWVADDNGTYSGAAYVFTRSGGVWTQQAKLLPTDNLGGDYFGDSVSVSGDTAVVGAEGDDDNGTSSGSAYTFTRSGGVWTERAKLLPADNAAGDRLGDSVSVSGNTALIGAGYDDDNGSASGSAYVFTTRTGSTWTEQNKITAGDGTADDLFGASVSVSGNTAVVGAYADSDNGFRSGSAFVFNLGCVCPADLNDDGVLNTHDVLLFLNAWSAGEEIGDWNDDGRIDTQDFLAYLNEWTAGCP